MIEVWHGLKQKVGHLGQAQSDFNLLGNVSDPDGVSSLSYRLNQGSPQALTIGDRSDGFGDGRRLAASGDFNVDLAISQLHPGVNTIELTATDSRGLKTSVTVSVERQAGSYPLPVRIAWRQVKDPQAVGQYVDGKWGLEGGGLRTLRTGYDRVFLIGEQHWQDYQVTVPVTINRVDAKTGPNSGPSAALGLLPRFTGHVIGGHRNFPSAQPKWGYQPFGAIGWLIWKDGPMSPPTRQFYRGDSKRTENFGTVVITPGRRYWMKMRCETLANDVKGEGVTRYSWELWADGQTEPAAWDWEVIQRSQYALRRGGIALLAHHVDATFGDLVITPLGSYP